MEESLPAIEYARMGKNMWRWIHRVAVREEITGIRGITYLKLKYAETHPIMNSFPARCSACEYINTPEFREDHPDIEDISCDEFCPVADACRAYRLASGDAQAIARDLYLAFKNWESRERQEMERKKIKENNSGQNLR